MTLHYYSFAYLFEKKFQNIYFILNNRSEYYGATLSINAVPLNFSTGYQIVNNVQILIPKTTNPKLKLFLLLEKWGRDFFEHPT